MPVATIDHIVIDQSGYAKIKDSRIKVIHLVMAKNATGGTVDELLEQYPHLPKASIYAAFAYYYDHKEELDKQIEGDENEGSFLLKEIFILRAKAKLLTSALRL